jgi:hypothetical protein
MAMVMPSMGPRERFEWDAEARAIELAGQANVVAAQLVDLLVEVLREEAWGGSGTLRSPEHWLCWRTGMAAGRAQKLVQIARRADELPACIALFRAGGLSEDAMALIARKAPAQRDGELADLAPLMLHAQLERVLRHLPEQERRTTPKIEPERGASGRFRQDGWWEGRQLLPPDEGAVAQKALESARSEVFAERHTDADPAVRGPVTWADGFVRLCEHALDGLDPDVQRGQPRGERAQVLVHLDARSDGEGHAAIHLGPQLPDALRRYLCCDAKVRAVIEGVDGALLGISPLAPTVSPRLRRVIEQRDQGCRYPGCSQRRWVQIHHLIHREDGGATVSINLCALCPYHHRLHHLGAFQISGNPELPAGLRFSDRWGHEIGPPHFGPVAPPVGTNAHFTPPTGERLEARWFGWN